MHVACIQLNSGNSIAENVETILQEVRQAADRGAKLIALPENAVLMESNGERVKSLSLPQKTHPALPLLTAIAKERNIWLAIGSIAVAIPRKDKLANRSFLINPKGEIVATYDKIHLFDSAPGENERYLESKRFGAGDKAVLVETPLGMIGLTICYDLRFPHLFRTLAQAGAECILVPAAFTYTTGIAHWHTLLRARAIENGCFIIAAAQCGMHPGKRQTFGHSLIVNPWGEIIAEAQDTPTTIYANLQLQEVKLARQRISSLSHDRPYSVYKV